jgi:hypothetical protein
VTPDRYERRIVAYVIAAGASHPPSGELALQR